MNGDARQSRHDEFGLDCSKEAVAVCDMKILGMLLASSLRLKYIEPSVLNEGDHRSEHCQQYF